VALGVLILSEPLTSLECVAFVLILVGSVLATRISRPARPQTPVGAAAATAPAP
jgi:drug/metabolite transporter (DMT)-like permease